MASIQSAIQLQDKMSQPLMTICSSIYDVVESMHDVESASSNMFDTSSITDVNSQLDATTSKIDAIENNIRKADSQQEQFNQTLQESHGIAGGLNNRLMQVAATVATAFGVGKIIGLSDEMTQTTARLDLMNDGLQTTEEFQQKIFESAQRSRGAYQSTADAVAKLGMQARGAFSSNDEIIAFTEQLNKNFVIAGTSAQGVESVMLQLTQAMAAGKLQGEELNAVLDNAQPIVANIQKYLEEVQNIDASNIKQLASDGIITAEIIKNAMFYAADETNAKFAQMPITWGQTCNLIKNQALMAFQPILKKINEIANSDDFKVMFNNMVNGLSNVAYVCGEIFTIIIEVTNFIYDNWSTIEPIIAGVTGAFIAYKLAVLGCKLAHEISIIAMGAYYTACAIGQIAVGNLTAAQAALNMTMLKNPIVFIAALIIGVLLVAFYQWMKGCGSVEVALLKMQYTAVTAWNNIKIAGLTFIDVILKHFGAFKIGMLMIWYGIQTGIETVCANIAITIEDMVNMAIRSINALISAVNVIPGVSIDTISEVTFGTNAATEAEARRQARDADLQSTIDTELSNTENRQSEIEQAKEKAANDAANIQSKIDDAVARSKSGDNESKSPYDILSNAYDLSTIGNGVKDTAANTAAVAKSVGDSTEELKYLRDVAEREVINRFTTAEIKIDMGGINNTVSNNVDLDGVVTYLEDKLNETLSSTAEQFNDK